MLKKKFLLGFIGFFSLLNASLHAMESEIESKKTGVSSAPTCKRKDYRDAVTDLFAGDQVKYKDGYLSIYDPDSQTLSFKFLGDEGEFTHIGLPPDTSKVYPVNNKDYFLYKSGPKEKRTLYFYDRRDPEHPSITLLGTKKHKEHHLGLVDLAPLVALSNTNNLIYFFQAESFRKEGKLRKQGKPCSSESKRAFCSHTKIFFFDPTDHTVTSIATFPFSSEKVFVNGENNFILAQVIKGQDIKFIRASSAHPLYLTLPLLLETGSWGIEEMDSFDNTLGFSKDAIIFLSLKETKKE
jgi:hypothetical protein